MHGHHGTLADSLLPTHPGRNIVGQDIRQYTIQSSRLRCHLAPRMKTPSSEINICVPHPWSGLRHCVDRLLLQNPSPIPCVIWRFRPNPGHFLLSLGCHWTTIVCISGTSVDRSSVWPITNSICPRLSDSDIGCIGRLGPFLQDTQPACCSPT